MKPELFLTEVCGLTRRYISLCRNAQSGELVLLSERLMVEMPILYRLRDLSDAEAEHLGATPYSLLHSVIKPEDIEAARREQSGVDALATDAKHVAREIRALNLRYVGLCKSVGRDQLTELVLRLNISYSLVEALRDCTMDQLERLVMRARSLVQLTVDARAIDHAVRLDDRATRYEFLAAAAPARSGGPHVPWGV